MATEPNIIKQNKNFLKTWWVRFGDFLKNHKADWKYLLLAIPIVAVYFLVLQIYNHQSLNSGAAVHNADVSFNLQDWALPPQNTFEVWVNVDSPVSFVRVVLNFDPSLVKLVSDPDISVSPLKNVVQVTSASEANTTGKIEIVLALNVNDKNNPPTGAFNFANLTFDSLTSQTDLLTQINFDTSDMQIVAADQTAFNITSSGLNLTLNQTSTPTSSTEPTIAPKGKGNKGVGGNSGNGKGGKK